MCVYLYISTMFGYIQFGAAGLLMPFQVLKCQSLFPTKVPHVKIANRMTWVSTHLGPTPKMSWGDGRRQAEVGDMEEQEVSNCVENVWVHFV